MSLSRLMQAAKESALEGGELPPEEQQEALEDTGLTAEVIEEVQAPAADLSTGLDDVASAEGEATALDNTAEQLKASVADGGAGADPVAANIAADQIQAAVERFQLAVGAVARPAKESFATSAGRRSATLALAKEAEDASKSLRERAMEAIRKAVEWLKEMVKAAFDRGYRIEKRAKALAAVAKASKVPGGIELKYKAGFLGGKTAIENARGLVGLASSLGELSSAVTDGGAATKAAIDLNPGEVGGVKMRVEFGDKATFVRESAPNDAQGKMESLDSTVATNVANMVAQGVAKLNAAKGEFDKITKDSLSLMNALRTEGGVKDKTAAVASVTAVTRAAANVLSLGLSTSSRLLDVVDASLKAKEAKPAGAAAAA